MLVPVSIPLRVTIVPVGNVTLFLQRAKRKIRELAYNFDVDGYVAPDMTILAEHISESGKVKYYDTQKCTHHQKASPRVIKATASD